MSASKHVVVVGGGVAGLTATHELLERGFRVTLVERRPLREIGGRARSYRRLLSGPNGAPGALEGPVEHGFRFFPSFYRNLDDTMSRIHRTAGEAAAGSVLDNLIRIDEEWLSVSGRRVIQIPASGPGGEHPSRRLMALLSVPKRLQDVGLTRQDLEIFSDKLFQFATSSALRRNVEYERIGWREYVESLDRSNEYYWYLASGLTRTLVAAKARKASTKTMGNTALRLLSGYEPDRTTDRVLNGPTNEAWFGPWISYIKWLGARAGGMLQIVSTGTVDHVTVERDAVTEISVRDVNGGQQTINDIDHVIVALSAPALDELLKNSSSLAKAFGRHARNNVRAVAGQHLEAMHGLQIFTRRPLPLNRGHQIFLDSAWGLTSLAQAKFWPPNHLAAGVGDILSIDISSWDLPGETIPTTTASQATRLQIFQEVRFQLSAALGHDFLRDEDILGWYLDEGFADAKERVMVNDAGSWALRPSVAAADENGELTRRGPSNLYLAGDWIRSKTDLACMEGANETARQAVNAILAADQSQREACSLFDPEDLELSVLRPLKDMDEARYKRGLPWSGVDAGAALVRTLWATHTIGAIALGQDEGGTTSAAKMEPPRFALIQDQASQSNAVTPPEPTPDRQPYRPRPELWHPAYQALVQPHTDDVGAAVKGSDGPTLMARAPKLNKKSVADAAKLARPLSDVQLQEFMSTIAAEPGRSDPMFQRWRPSIMSVGPKEYPIPFLVYNGDTLVIHGRVHNFAYLEHWTKHTGYWPVHSLERGRKAGFAELWLIRYTDTIGGIYDEAVINFVVTKTQRGPYRWRSPYSSVVPMMDSANGLFTPRLLLNVKQELHPNPIDYGNELFGMDKRPGEIEIRRNGYVKEVICREGGAVIRATVDESPSAALDIESGIELAREFGAIQLLKNAQQIRNDEEIKGGMITPDFRLPAEGNRLGRRETVSVQARYKFNARLIPLDGRALEVQNPGPSRQGEGRAGSLASVLAAMHFEPQIAAIDPHLKSVLFLEGWPTPAGPPEPDRPLRLRLANALRV